MVAHSREVLTISLEGVVDTKCEVVAVKVKAEALFAKRIGIIVIVTIAEETAMGNEVDVLAELYIYSRTDTYIPSVVGVTVDTIARILVSRESEATIEEDAYGTKFNGGVAGIRSYLNSIVLDSFVVGVFVTNGGTDGPFVRKNVTNFRNNLEVRLVGISVSPETDLATYINLCAGGQSHYCYKQCQ